MLTLETGTGLTDADTYQDLDGAQTFFDGHLFGDKWGNFDVDTQERALRLATRMLDDRMEWKGYKASLAQHLQWPRVGVYLDGYYMLDHSVIPWQIVTATSELALYLAQQTSYPEPSDQIQQVQEIDVGPIKVRMPPPSGQTVKPRIPFPEHVIAAVRDLGWYRGGRWGSGRIIR
jgi:hypothetical protein